MNYAEEHRYVFEVYESNQDRVDIIYNSDSLYRELILGRIRERGTEGNIEHKFQKGLKFAFIVDSKLPMERIDSSQREVYKSLHRNPNYLQFIKIVHFQQDDYEPLGFKTSVFDFGNYYEVLNNLGSLDKEQKKTAIDFLTVTKYESETSIEPVSDSSVSSLTTINAKREIVNALTMQLCLKESGTNSDGTNSDIALLEFNLQAAYRTPLKDVFSYGNC